MKIMKLTCPNCGAPLEFDKNRPIHFCGFCGTPLLFDDESQTININYKEEKHFYDEARIKEAENKREEIKLKKHSGLKSLLIGFGYILLVYLFYRLLFSLA